MARGPRIKPPSLESLFIAAFALIGLRLGLRSIGDNSTFWHLRTGIDIVSGRGIPRRDPYSFTAPGTPWVVQSWLPEAVYGIAHRMGGYRAIVYLHGALYAVLAGLIARLARAASLPRTCLAAGIALLLGAVYWSPRPLAFGLVALALLILIVENGWSRWWLVPLAWVWVNSHGSFALGLGWLVVVALGERLDGQRRPPSLRYLGAFAAGLLASAVNPLGPRLLIFPVTVLSRRAIFQRVIEWRAPSFTGVTGATTLVALAAVLAVLLASRRRSWRDTLVAVVFIAAGLAAQRNLPVAAIVLAPVLGKALDAGAGAGADAAARRSRERPLLNAAIAAVMAIEALAFIASVARGPALDFGGYPVALLRRVPDRARLAAPDTVGGLRILQGHTVFVDDRVDMYPTRVMDDYLQLFDGGPRAEAVLDRYRVDAVVWERSRPLASILATNGHWRRAATAKEWSLFVRE